MANRDQQKQGGVDARERARAMEQREQRDRSGNVPPTTRVGGAGPLKAPPLPQRQEGLPDPIIPKTVGPAGSFYPDNNPPKDLTQIPGVDAARAAATAQASGAEVRSDGGGDPRLAQNARENAPREIEERQKQNRDPLEENRARAVSPDEAGHMQEQEARQAQARQRMQQEEARDRARYSQDAAAAAQRSSGNINPRAGAGDSSHTARVTEPMNPNENKGSNNP